LEKYLTKVYTITIRLGNRGLDKDDLVKRVWPTIWKAIPDNIWDKIRALVPEFTEYRVDFTAAVYEERPYEKFLAVRSFILSEAKRIGGLEASFKSHAMVATTRRAASSRRDAARGRRDDRPKKRPYNEQKCEPCDTLDHRMSECPMPIEGRLQFLKNEKRCVTCLSKEHEVQSCTRRYLCKRCYNYDDNNSKDAMHHWWACPKRVLNNPAKKARESDQNQLTVQAAVARIKSEPIDSEESAGPGSSDEDA
jgi:hypothetical protein